MKTDRTEWFDKIVEELQIYNIVIIQGLRRIGKTLLMNSVADDDLFSSRKRIEMMVGIFGQDDTQVALEIIEEIKNNPDVQFMVTVDEFQDLKDWEKFFKTIHLYKNAKVIATGSISANKDLINNTEGGRFSYLHMKPLTFNEFKIIYSKKSILPNDDYLFNLYATMGSYPDQEFSRDFNNLSNYKKQISENILEKIKNNTLLQKADIRDPQIVMTVLLHIIENNGGLMTPNNISNKLSFHINSVKKALNYLVQTFIIYNLSNINYGAGRAAAVNNKYYLTDHSFSLFVHGTEFDKLSNDKPEQANAIFENIIINHVSSAYEDHEVKVNFIKTKDVDIDLVATVNGVKKYIEIKNTDNLKSLSQGQLNFLRENDGFVVYRGETTNKHNIQYVNHIEFIKGVKKWI